MYYAISPEAKRLIDLLFQTFARSLRADRTLFQDRRKLRRRLAMRDQGSCCVGFGNQASVEKSVK